MNAERKSDGSIVAAKPANEAAVEASAELAEERDPAKRNAEQAALHRTQSRGKSKSRGLLGVREAAREDSKLRFTALLHHIDKTALALAFGQLQKSAAVGVDGVTWQDYEQNVEENIASLHGRIHRGAYRAKPSRRAWIPKPEGRQRPLGIASLEDKIVQQAVATVLQSIYEEDFIGFEHRDEAQACMEELRARLAKFGLKLHGGKTRLIEFGRYAANNRKRRGEGKPETFDFLGFIHKCSRTRAHGYFTIHRQTVAKRIRATLAEIKRKLRKRWHRPLAETGRWLRRVVQGRLNYYAVPGNGSIVSFVSEVTRHWLRAIRRRSQKGRNRWTWERMNRFYRNFLPLPRLLHPYPNVRFCARLKAGAV